MRDFDSFIRECELLDPPLRNASFTWSNLQKSPVCKRLDRFLYSNEWGLLFPQGLQEALIRRTSDHWPIVMDTNPFMWGPTPFSAKGWVKASRGLRQGDPLSPFLFTLVADVLSRMLMRAEERNMMEGFRTLKSLLLVFGHISGLKVNLNKSSIYGINLDQAHLSRLAEMLDCKASGWPILYLGLPLGGNPKACGFWDPVVERISSRLDGWQKAYLSFGGRITLIQSCLTHLPSYFLSLFKIPASVAAKIERMQRDFLWSGVGEGKRDHLVRWDVVCKPKTIGGLGLGNISWRNLALLGKWLWRYPREGSALWHQVILSIYGSHSNGWDANTLVRWSHRCPWKAIAQVFQGFSLITRSRSISAFLVEFEFLRNLSDSEIEDLEGLMRIISIFWISSELSSKFVWNSQVPFKVKSFVWLVAHKKVNTNDMLQVRRPYKALSPDICILCMKHGESADHLFLHCSLTIGLWHRLFQLAKMDWVPPRSIYDMMSIKFKGFGNSKRGIVLWQAASIALIRVVWWERNARIFEDKARNSGFLWDSIVFLASLWAFCSKAFKGFPLNVIQLDWIAQVGGLTSDLLSQRASRKGELEELILREEIHWRQKARVKWVKEGDCNSKFYHKVANGRRNRKYIKELENDRGLVLKNAESITEEILLYFEKLYTSPTGESWSVEGLDWSPISEESALRLDSPFTEEEISKAIFQMDRDKAPGPDDFTIAIFQDWHLRGVLHETIHYTQGAFVQGRQILDAVLITSEIVDERRRSGEEGVVFKIDFEKAYDHMKWDFLDHVLEKKGFSPRWRKWMSGCLSSVSYAILVNGSTKGVGRNRTRVSHLQFADDTIFFSNTREEELQTLKSLLLVFGHISGLKVNLDKVVLLWPILIRLIFQDWLRCLIARRRMAYTLSGSPFGDWEGKRDHLVRWDVVCKPKAIGGLGFGNISWRNLALLGKWLWRHPREGSLFGIRKRGKNSFWEDLWWGDQPLGTHYPRLFRVVVDKNILISSVLGPTRPFSWNLNFRRNLSDSEIEDLEGLMRSLDELHLSPSVPDARFWPLSSSRLFSVKSFFLALSQFLDLLRTFLQSSFGILKFLSK
ncbi:putative ribonuclease H protein [Vitis vinifera]|uniref:Putative ribonuclease H protein n=1 Tax=Vitis vinifera TaxID=29760 RepID=A0A438G2V0_VITVI|nr:putative ribonuclease H protein [Vitis vinifera]